MLQSFYKYSYDELVHLFESNNLNPVAASVLFRWHYKHKNLTACELPLAQKSSEFVKQFFDFTLPKIHTVIESQDQTVKFLIELQDLKTVECVLIPFQNKYSICISTQVGCAMNCSFCFTAKQGFLRHLTCEEIIGQYLLAWDWLRRFRPDDFKIKSIVFMGQGEPLHNFDHVKKACEILVDQHGASVGLQRTTISTAGYLPGLRRWIDEGMPSVNIALSLHSAFNHKRDQLILLNKKYPIEDLLLVLDQIPLHKKQFVTYEYLVIKDFNDQDEDIHALGGLLKGRRALINLIAFNPFPGAHYQRPDLARLDQIQLILAEYNIPTMIRSTKGDDILAACGQLNSKIQEGLNEQQ